MVFPHKASSPLTRREALRRVGNGFGMMAFAGMVGESIAQAGGIVSADGQLGASKLDHPAKVKRVIFLFMNGGCSAVDSFDPKPALTKYDGQPMPGGGIKTERRTGELMKSPFAFKKYGQSGMDLSELWPKLGEVADDSIRIHLDTLLVNPSCGVHQFGDMPDPMEFLLDLPATWEISARAENCCGQVASSTFTIFVR